MSVLGEGGRVMRATQRTLQVAQEGHLGADRRQEKTMRRFDMNDDSEPRRLRVLVVLPSQGVYGGMELFAITVADWLNHQPGFEVRICFKLVHGYHVREELENRCSELGLAATYCTRASALLVKAIMWADVVHANNCSPDITLTTKLLRRPLLLTVHNWRRPDNSLRNWLWGLAHRAADHRTYNSHFVMQSWAKNELLPNSEVIPTVSGFRGSTVPSDQRRGFFFIARWIEGKGIPELIEAYQRAEIDKKRWPLTMAGDGPLRARVTAQLGASGSAGIFLRGFLSEVEKYELMANSKWLVCPPNTNEDMGLTPIEARSLGIPSIVTVDGGLPEAAGSHAIFCPRGNSDALARALELAAGLSEGVYAARSRGAVESLERYLRPLSCYADIYRAIDVASGIQTR